MKTGIITMHFPENYGAVLQAYALQQYTSRFCEVEIINYIHNPKYSRKSNSILTLFRKIRATGGKIKRIGRDIPGYIERKKRAEKFSVFQREYFKLSQNTYHGDREIFAAPPRYDFYISGSDQIWNTNITNNSAAYYLGFVNSGKKYSYASSFGHRNLTDKEYEFSQKYLSLYADITVRESMSARQLSEWLGRPVEVMTDPVFLLSKAEWTGMVKRVECLKDRDFIFVYNMQYNQAMIRTVKAVEKYGLAIIVVNGGGTKIHYNARELKDCGPQEFLWLILNAKYVVTNSFHGAAFSLIFGKNVWICEHTVRNLRLEELLSWGKSEDKQIREDSTWTNIDEKMVDGQKVYDMIDVEKGRHYIQEILGR
ncbi:MAG: polysaccharide pyruvyl transferase family protein [Lachnospiraceae bacterium]|jgi:hypothetical protein|nr:polysaccharide pyruvyl transferase family protein [Lachnospiraceae bacterium]